MEKKKNLKYLAKCNAINIDFKPIVFDAFGLPSKTTSSLKEQFHQEYLAIFASYVTTYAVSTTPPGV